MRQRRRDYALADPRKSRILIKLLALRCWLGRRKVAKVPLRQLRALTMALKRGDADAAEAADRDILAGLDGVMEVDDEDDEDDEEEEEGGRSTGRRDEEMGGGAIGGMQAGGAGLSTAASALMLPGRTDER